MIQGVKRQKFKSKVN